MNRFLGPKPPSNVTDIRGNTYNRWQCVGYSHKAGSVHFWYLRCRCGTEVVRRIGHVVSGKSTSCGCAHKENLAKRNRIHGLTTYPVYQIWKAVNQRCKNKKHKQYKDYGGRGITVCAEWQGIEGAKNFIRDMGSRPDGASIERRDNTAGYSPANCYWATKSVQARNKRNNLLITAFGRTQCLAAWSEEIGAHQSALYWRIVTAKWNPEKALTKPFNRRL